MYKGTDRVEEGEKLPPQFLGMYVPVLRIVKMRKFKYGEMKY
jgi:hypothetical protein